MAEYWPHITLWFAVEILIVLVWIPWILTIKKEAISAMAWCMIVLLVPFLGAMLFVAFGYTRVDRPIRRKRRHHARYLARHPGGKKEAAEAAQEDPPPGLARELGQLATKMGAMPPCGGNAIALYHDTQAAFDQLCDAVSNARHHVHLQYFIVQPDDTGRQFLALLERKAKEGVQVRLLYDAMGSRRLSSRLLVPLIRAEGQCHSFLGLNPFRHRLQVNMRNHRKIAVIDGRIGFTGGANIGDEYLGKDPHFGYWRDSNLRLEGPAVAALQSIFVEDWDFATGKDLQSEDYFPDLPRVGEAVVQVVESGPDQETNHIREVLFAAITLSRERLWIASPYIVPDQGLLDGLLCAARRGVDVRLLCPLKPDHWLTYFAGRYYFDDFLTEGIKLYEYAKGMMHAKIIVVDNQWAAVGSANLDYRSLHLNFEADCFLCTPALVKELADAFEHDLQDAVRLETAAFRRRSRTARLVENMCRLLSPVL